jgi:hypothetical protein
MTTLECIFLSAQGLITIGSGPHDYLFILLTITTTELSRAGEHHKYTSIGHT